MGKMTRQWSTQRRARELPPRPPIGHRTGGLASALVLFTAWLATVAVPANASAQRPAALHTNRPALKRQVGPAYTYDLVTALGAVYNFGGAGWYGDERSQHLAAPIVGMAVTPDGRGYWLVGSNGAVYCLGDARCYGSLADEMLGVGQQVVAIAATADGKGYWLVDQSGAVTSFGDATVINGGQPLPPADVVTPIVSAAIAPGGIGAWFTDSAGHVYTSGRAPWFGSRVNKQPYPITSIAAIPSGLGYWLSDSAGDVWGFAGATASASAPAGLDGTAVGLIPAGNGLGYWLATSSGSVLSGGDAPRRAGTATDTGISDVVGIAAAPQIDPAPFPFGTVGYDINWPECASTGSSQAGTLPGPPKDAAGSTAYSIAVVGVDGWAVDDDNTCLAAEVAWADNTVYPAGSGETGAPPYDLYMFLNSPGPDSTIDKTGPAGTCARLSGTPREACLTYNYGYNAAITAVNYAASQGAEARTWWLDIENDTCAPGMWNDEADGEWWSCDVSLNAVTIQGALDALRSLGITTGIYCTAAQWAGITGSYLPTGGAPLLWVAGATWTSPPYPHSDGLTGPEADAKFCTDSKYFFAGGEPVMLQETPGSNNYVFDPDIAC